MLNGTNELAAYSDEHLHEILQSTLQKTFGLNAFRQGQKEALTTLLRKKRLLCIQPTGHGKSLLYQLPAVLLPGMTVVLSPLLALMRDQIQQLNQRFNISAASINSDQTEEDNGFAAKNARDGSLKILFVAPEKLDNINYFDFLLKLPISLVVVDEAHCISTWGHDFRPSYRQIIHFVRQLEEANEQLMVLAITATANKKTEHDITQQLTYADHPIAVQRQSLSRPNLQLDNVIVHSIAEKLWVVKQLLQQLPGHGLIYCATRENTELVATYLKHHQYRAAAYHAGLHPDLKQQLQHEFINNQYQVIAATNALGMGIDKADLRYVIHFDVVGSMTAYYQEVGRAGRDGLPARGILLFDDADKKIQHHFIDSAQPRLSDFEAITEAVRTNNKGLTLSAIKCETGLHPTRVTIVLAALMEQGFILKQAMGKSQVYVLTARTEPIDFSRFQRQLDTRQLELAHILRYGSEQSQCLMMILRAALGDVEVEPCGKCNVCTRSELILTHDRNEINTIEHWLAHRVMTIDLGKLGGCSAGSSIFDSRLRLPLFIEFMKNRQCVDKCINEKLWALVKTHLIEFLRHIPCTAIVVIPSKTWVQREQFANLLAYELNLPLYLDAISWRQEPAMRQGECLNNDQRQHNVSQHMVATFNHKKPEGSILLFDDYVGSGATLKEAARALIKQAGLRHPIVPFTIANVKWRLGQRGMI